MSKINIGVSGDVGSFSEEAGEKYIKDNGLENAEIAYLISAKNVFSALDGGNIDIGIMPIENSNGGVVFEVLNEMGNHLFHIKEYFDIEVNHSLIVKEEVKADEIKKISSHDHAFRQCRAYIKHSWPSAELDDFGDTAGAAKALSSGELSSDTAVIAASRCVKMYPELEILEDKIQDLKYNYTTFLAVEKKTVEEANITATHEIKGEELNPHVSPKN